MAENLTIEAPDFERIKKEAGDATRDATNTLWSVLNAVDATQRRGIRKAQEFFQPRTLTFAHTANMNNYDHANSTLLVFTGTAAVDLTGIKAPESNKSAILILHNMGTGTITVKHNSGSSIAENRISMSAGVDFSLATGKSLILAYISGVYRQIV
jgi:hypothetical protein